MCMRCSTLKTCLHDAIHNPVLRCLWRLCPIDPRQRDLDEANLIGHRIGRNDVQSRMRWIRISAWLPEILAVVRDQRVIEFDAIGQHVSVGRAVPGRCAGRVRRSGMVERVVEGAHDRLCVLQFAQVRGTSRRRSSMSIPCMAKKCRRSMNIQFSASRSPSRL